MTKTPLENVLQQVKQICTSMYHYDANGSPVDEHIPRYKVEQIIEEWIEAEKSASAEPVNAELLAARAIVKAVRSDADPAFAHLLAVYDRAEAALKEKKQ